MDAWCILRTSAGSTLRLVKALRSSDFEVWTPIETVTKRARKGERPEPVETPILPSFAFARANRLVELIELARSPSLTFQVWDAELRRMVTKGYPHFSIFRNAGDYALIADKALDPLRLLEQRKRPKAKAHVFEPGELVRLTSVPGLAGMIGTVHAAVKRKSALVLFPDWPIPLLIPNWALLPAA